MASLRRKLAAILLLGSLGSRADTSKEAEMLFQQGRQLMAEKTYAQACTRFEQSQRLEPALGTLLNWADCLERAGMRAQAFKRFNEAASWAARNHETKREEVAKQRAEALQSQLTFVRPKLAEAPVGATAIVYPRGSEQLVLHRWSLADASSEPVPLDVGDYQLDVEAPGRAGITLDFVVDETPRRLTIEVAPLTQRVQAPEVRPTVIPPKADPTPNQPLWPPVVLAIGGTLTGVGVAGVVYVQIINSRVLRQQAGGPDADSPTVTRAEFQTVRTLYPAAWASVGVGVATCAVGVLGLALLPQTSPQIAIVPGPNSLSLSGTF